MSRFTFTGVDRFRRWPQRDLDREGAGGRRSRAVVRATLVAAMVGSASFAFLPTGLASANSPITSFSITPSTTQAGGHPNIMIHETDLTRGSQTYPEPNCGCQDPRDVTFELPTGLVGDPHATPQCSQSDFGSFQCPIDSQIGKSCVVALLSFCPLAVYNMVPAPGEAGLIAFNIPILNFPIYVVLNARTGSDYGLTSTVTGVTHVAGLSELNLTLWGVPADPSNDSERFGPRGCSPESVFRAECHGGYSSNAAALPFLENPTSCGVTLSASEEILSYDGGVSQAQAPYPATTGCDQLSFNPSLFVQPTTQQTDSASGSDVDLHVPQESSPGVPAPSEIRALTVELPPGFTLTPNASDGKTSCLESEAHFGSEEAAECPEFSKVGSATLSTALLPGPLNGYIYIGTPEPGHPYRFFVTAEGFNTNVKIEGVAEPNSQTGQLTLNFPKLPQTPFEDFYLHFFGSERGLLATPSQCGTYPVNGTFTPWDSSLPEQHSTQFFVLNSGPNGAQCPASLRPFHPGFQAGVTNATAGVHSAFTLDLTRNDGDQELRSANVSTPPGFSATLVGIPYCSDAEISAAANPGYSGAQQLANPSCPAASQVGSSDVGTGAGTHPVYFPGTVYLAGPYRGAPLSLAVITPGISGPYDLGSVVVRAALHINPETAQITAISDPLPQILQGIPLRLRSIMLNFNRHNFTLNPTDCDPFSVGAEIGGDQGSVAIRNEPFQVADCGVLGFEPRLSLKITGATKHTGFPALTATLTTKPGEANVARTSVTLPHSEFLENAHLKSPCLRTQFAEGDTPGERCPTGSDIGFAKVETPLLGKPLEGPVYLRSSGNRLPDIVATLNGQIDIDLVGHVSAVKGRLRTTFETVPDAPITKFTLHLEGGRKGLLVNSTNLCQTPDIATERMSGQNGKSANQNAPLQVACGSNDAQRRHLRRSKVAD